MQAYVVINFTRKDLPEGIDLTPFTVGEILAHTTEHAFRLAKQKFPQIPAPAIQERVSYEQQHGILHPRAESSSAGVKSENPRWRKRFTGGTGKAAGARGANIEGAD